MLLLLQTSSPPPSEPLPPGYEGVFQILVGSLQTVLRDHVREQEQAVSNPCR